MRRTRLVLLAAALSIFAGCSGGSSGNGGPDGAAAPAPSPDAGRSATTAAPSGNGDPFCNFIRTYQDRFGRINLALADPQQFRVAMEEAAAAVRDAHASAPPAIRADVATLGDAFQRLLTILQQVNYDVSKVSFESLAALSAPEFTAASERLDTYQRENCL